MTAQDRTAATLRRQGFWRSFAAACIEDAKYHGGLETVEDEMRLNERMNAQLRRFDSTKSAPVSAATPSPNARADG